MDSERKPILFIYAEHIGLLDKYGEGLRDLLQSDYADVFECFVTTQEDQPASSKLYATKD